MKKKLSVIIFGTILVALGIILTIISKKPSKITTVTVSTPVEEAAQLAPSEQPEITLKFTPDAHFVTVSINNIKAEQLEYNLIYDATVKGSSLQTGVNATASLGDKSTYEKKQLLGSESSGKFTYHSNIKNAVMELTLRDKDNRSVFSQTYPFEVVAGSSVILKSN